MKTKFTPSEIEELLEQGFMIHDEEIATKGELVVLPLSLQQSEVEK